MHIICAVCRQRFRDYDETSQAYRAPCSESRTFCATTTFHLECVLGHIVCRLCLSASSSVMGGEEGKILPCGECHATISFPDCTRLYLSTCLDADDSDKLINDTLDK